MIKSEQIDALAMSLAKAQKELANPKKTTTNAFFKNRYAELSEVINVSKPVLAEHGLSVMQFLSYDSALGVIIETMMLHETGQFIGERLIIPLQKIDAQGLGSAATYGRRYAWAAICGLAQEDDDGSTASAQVSAKIIINDNDVEIWDTMKNEFRGHGDIKKIFKKYDLTDDQINRLYEENDSI